MKNSIQKSMTTLLLTACAGLFLTVPAYAGDPDPNAMVDALNGVFGKHAARASHAKGVCASGSFTPSAEAKSLSKAAQFQSGSTVLARFSMGGGNPKIPDSTKPNARGFAVHFDLGGGKSSDLVMFSAPIFFAKTTDQFMGFLQARVPAADGKPDPEKVKAFGAANPDTTKQAAWLNQRPVPSSYAGMNFWAVHAFTLTNDAGVKSVVKFKAIPAAGELTLTDDEAKAKPADFYSGDLKERLGTGAVSYTLTAIVGDAADQTDDPTVLWPEDQRKSVALGTIAIAAIEDDAKCNAITFDPSNLTEGVAGPTNDPIFAARSAAYAVSMSRRAN